MCFRDEERTLRQEIALFHVLIEYREQSEVNFAKWLIIEKDLN